MELSDVVLELDRMSMEILDALGKYGGSATTSEIKTVVAVADTTSIHYRRKEYLEPLELVETYQDETERAPFPPMEWELTETGEKVIEDHLNYEHLNDGVTQQIASLEAKISSLQDELTDMKTGTSSGAQRRSAGSSPGEVPEDIEERLEGLQEQVSALAADVSEMKQSPVFDDDYQFALNAAILMGSTSKRFLKKEYGEDMLNRVFTEAKQHMSEQVEAIPSPEND